MTEADWMTCQDPQAMLAWLRDSGVGSPRQLRLFAAACARRLWRHLEDETVRIAVETAERYADRKDSEAERGVEQVKVVRVMPSRQDASFRTWLRIRAYRVVACSLAEDARAAARGAAHEAPRAEGIAGLIAASREQPDGDEFKAMMATLRSPYASLLRHIVGNPYRPFTAPPSWPTTVVSLAEAVYNGADAAFALHDALLEAGHPDLAEHFRAESCHPKGCWALDVILQRS